MAIISYGIPAQYRPLPAALHPDFGGKFVVLSVGRLAPEKRHDRLIAAVRRSRYEPRIQLVLAEHHAGDLPPGAGHTIGPFTIEGPVYDSGRDVPLPVEAAHDILAIPEYWEPGGYTGGLFVGYVATEAGERAWREQTF